MKSSIFDRMSKKKPIIIGTVTFGVDLDPGDVKPGLPTDEMFKLMRKASRENLLKPKEDVCFN